MEESFPERSRYNHRCRSLRWSIKWIRHRLAKRGKHHVHAVVDSLPIKWCHYARASRVKRFREVADMGYCASKKMFFYGFKLHIQITDQSLPMGYVVTAASYHDRIVAEEVMTQLPHPYTLGDKGYVSQPLQKKLHHEYGIAFWTPFRKNQQVSGNNGCVENEKSRKPSFRSLWTYFVSLRSVLTASKGLKRH